MTALTGNRVPGTLRHLPMVTAGGVDGLPRPAQGQSLHERENDDRSRAGEMFAFHWPVNDWYSVPANDYLDKRRPEYAREEARGAIVYRRESGQSGGRVYFSPDCSLTILAVF